MSAPALLAELLGCALAAFGVLWVLSLWLRDASIVDLYWGPGFLLLAAVAHGLAEAPGLRAGMALVCVGLWGLRLGLYLLWRNAGHGEDPRYQAMRRRSGPSFGWRSLFTVFWLQAALQWVVAWPVVLAIHAEAAPLGVLDVLGLLVFATGLAFESVGDWQLARFKADPANRGKVMDRGLWAWTRHPNYFGDFLVWWGLFGLAAAAGAWWTVVGPVVMSFLLMRVSGVPLTEQRLEETREGFAAYRERTPAFFPRPPRRRPA